jgi:twitching motility protein PilT
MNLQTLLQQCVECKASDVHLSAGEPARLRIDGDLVRVSDELLSHDDIYTSLVGIMSSAHIQHFSQQKACDFAYEAPGISRFRVNVFQQARGVAAVFRAIAQRVPDLDALQAPKILEQLVRSARGLVLVTGPTGSGKSTTIAAMIDRLNQTAPKHILTIEDPVEFVHQPARCLINQREVGSHTLSFANALSEGLREDPDVIFIGEMRDLDTIRLALTAAETGHLVFATLHTPGAPKSIDRIIDVFPAAEKEMVRSMLSESLNAVISQVLCQRKEGVGRVAAYEIMVATPAIRHLIREGKVAQMYSVIQTGSACGMQTLDQSLSALVAQGAIDPRQASEKAKMPDSQMFQKTIAT